MFQDFHYPFSLPIPPRWKLIHGCLRTATVRLLTNSEDGLVPQAWREWGPPARRRAIAVAAPRPAEVPNATMKELPDANAKMERGTASTPTKEVAPSTKEVEVEKASKSSVAQAPATAV